MGKRRVAALESTRVAWRTGNLRHGQDQLTATKSRPGCARASGTPLPLPPATTRQRTVATERGAAAVVRMLAATAALGPLSRRRVVSDVTAGTAVGAIRGTPEPLLHAAGPRRQRAGRGTDRAQPLQGQAAPNRTGR